MTHTPISSIASQFLGSVREKLPNTYGMVMTAIYWGCRGLCGCVARCQMTRFSTSSLPFVRSVIHVRWSGRNWIASLWYELPAKYFFLFYFQSSGHLTYLLYISLLPFTPQILPRCGRKRNDEDEYQFHESTLITKVLNVNMNIYIWQWLFSKGEFLLLV